MNSPENTEMPAISGVANGLPGPDQAKQKFAAVIALATLGLALFVAGMVLPFVHAPFREVFAGGLVEWRKQPMPLVVTGLLLAMGIGLLLAGSLMARGSEHQAPSLRRLMYGANTLVAGMLLVGILLFVNVFSNLRLGRFDIFNQTFDHTESSLYTLSQSSTAFLNNLTDPVQVFLFVNPFSGSSQFVRAELGTLAENCKRIQPGLLRYRVLEVPSDLEEYDKLGAQYQFPKELGMLVVYGPDGKQNHEFVKLTDLFRQNRDPATTPGQPGAGSSLQFLGEAKLFETLTFLSENKTKGVLYLTSGNGEPDTVPGPAGDSVSELTAELAKANFRVEKLVLDSSTQRVPADADIVLMVGTRVDPPAEGIAALERFLQGGENGKKDKLLVMLDAAQERQGGRKVFSPLPRLKGLLARLQVEVDDAVLVSSRVKPHNDAVAIPNLRSTSALAKAFVSQGQPLPFPMREARPLRAVQSPPANPGASPAGLQAEPFLVAYPQFDTRPVTDLAVSLDELVKSDGWKDGKNPAKPATPIVLGLAVQEGPLPRAVVVGNAKFVSDEYLKRMGDTTSLELVASCCGWLRERPSLGSKPLESSQRFERKTYQLRARRDTAELSRLRWLPLGLAFVTIAGLGAGMWLVRRN